MSRPQIILFAAVGAALLLILVGLRPRPERSVALSAAYEDNDPQALDDDHEIPRMRRGSARITSLSASEPRHEARVTSQSVRITPLQRTEGYEAQKERAFGDSRIHGFVRGQDGKPLVGAQVDLYENDPMTDNPPLRTAYTDSEGSYTLQQLNDADRYYILVARAEGHAPEAQRVAMPRRPVRVDIRLSRGVPLSGTVRDALTSQPIAGATVYYPSRGEEVFGVIGKATTGANGQFSFPLVREGRVRAQATADGYRRTVQRLTAPGDQAEIPMIPGGATVRGVTVSRLTQKPVGGSKVVASSRDFLLTTLARQDGTFEFNDLPAGEYRLYALRGGVRSADTKLRLGDQEVKEDVELVVADELFVSGRVERAGSGEPIPGVRVWYKGDRGSQSVLSDENGRFGFETLALNEYTLEVHERNLLPVLDRRTTGAVETITRKVPPGASSDEVVIRLRSTRSISGTVVVQRGDGQNRRASRIWGADVVVDYKIGDFYERVRTRTDTRGNFFVNLPNQRRGDARIAAGHRGLVAVATTRVPTRQPVELQLKSTYFRGRLLLSDATPLSGVRIRTRNFLYRDKNPDSNFPLPGMTVYTGLSGGFNIPVGTNQQIEVTFELPDDRIITKHFSTNQLISRRRDFVYDPVSGDIITDGNRSRNRQSGPNRPASPRPAPPAAPAPRG